MIWVIFTVVTLGAALFIMWYFTRAAAPGTDNYNVKGMWHLSRVEQVRYASSQGVSMVFSAPDVSGYQQVLGQAADRAFNRLMADIPDTYKRRLDPGDYYLAFCDATVPDSLGRPALEITAGNYPKAAGRTIGTSMDGPRRLSPFPVCILPNITERSVDLEQYIENAIKNEMEHVVADDNEPEYHRVRVHGGYYKNKLYQAEQHEFYPQG